MPDPDDDWGDLARELGVQKPASPPPAAVPAEPEDAPEPDFEPAEDEAGFAEGVAPEDVGDDDGSDDAAEGEAAGGEEAAGDGQPGTGRKRRRRRRRRKKGGEGGEVADAGIADEPAPSYQAAGRAPVAAPGAPAVADEDETDDEAEVGGVVPAAEEDTAGEALRDLIAGWNVPSWDEIITGLHRP